MNQLFINSKSNLIKNRYIIANIILIGLMVTAFAFTVMQLIKFFLPDWKGGYIPIIGFLMAVEAILSHRVITEIVAFSKEWLLHIFFEWILILLFIKIVIYLTGSLSQFLQELSLLGNNFFKHFFTTEYTIAIVCTCLFWFIAIFLSDSIRQLEEDKDLMDQEKLGFTINDRTSARKRLITSFFSIGSVQLFITALLNNDFAGLPKTNTSTRQFIMALVIYFLFGFMLLALNQYNLQKARWYLSDIPVSDNVPKQWLKYSIAILSLVTLIVVFLPTSFILGIFPLFRYLGNLLVYLFQLVQALLLIPLMALMKLFSNEPSSEITQEPIEQRFPIEPLEQVIPKFIAEVPWWSLVRSTLFWLVFVLLIYFSITFFLKQNREWLIKLKLISLKNWFDNLWLIIKNLYHKTKKESKIIIDSGFERIRLLFIKAKEQFPTKPNFLWSLPPRIGTILRYIEVINWLSKNNFPTRSTYTPSEFARQFIEVFPQLSQNITSITDLFIKARYTKSSISKAEFKNFVSQISELKSQFK